ncbi:MAG: phosphoribosylanthranilate isomerase [Taibaiella sp.]|jgi:phosphoribosylanthranilate isomerase
MKVKICGLTEKQNLLDVLSLCPDYIGLNFYPGSKRSARDNKELISLMHSITDACKTGVFVNERRETILETVNVYKLDCVQLHGDEPPVACAAVNASNPVIKAFQMIPAFDFKQLHDYVGSCTYFLFDNPSAGYGGSGQCFDWNVLLNKEIPLPFFLSGGIGFNHVAQLKNFRHDQLIGVDVNSKFEQSPGVKNINDLKAFIHEIRN